MSWKARVTTESAIVKPSVQAVVGILRKKDTFLLAQRPFGKPYSGYWEFPGGKIEKDESSFAALKRELHEELGIDVTQAHHWFSHTHAYPEKTVHLDLWLVTEFVGEPQSKENQQLRWATLVELMQLDVLAGNWTIIDQLRTLSVSELGEG